VAGAAKVIDDRMSFPESITCSRQPWEKDPLKVRAHLLRTRAALERVTREPFQGFDVRRCHGLSVQRRGNQRRTADRAKRGRVVVRCISRLASSMVPSYGVAGERMPSRVVGSRLDENHVSEAEPASS